MPARCTFISCLGSLWIGASVAAADVLYVDQNATPGGDGASWAQAFQSLQDALAASSEGDEIRIAKGTYRPAPPNGPRIASFTLNHSITLHGGFAGIGAPDPDANDPAKFETFLSGDLNGNDGPHFTNYADNSYNVITAMFIENVTLRGITITGGSADLPPANFCSATPWSEGGGVIARVERLIMEDCIVKSNRAWCHGGGVNVRGGTAEFTRCVFDFNRVQGGYAIYGGAVFCTARSAFVDCMFIDNYSTWYCGAVWASESGSRFQSCYFRNNFASVSFAALSGNFMQVVDCTFDQSVSTQRISNVAASNSSFVNCRFTRASAAVCEFDSGAALRLSGHSEAVNCYFAGSNGGIATIGISGAANRIINCTVVGNRACAAAVHVMVSGDLMLRNSVIWGNTSSTAPSAFTSLLVEGAADVQHCAIEGWTASGDGSGNHGNNPRFVNAPGPDNLYGTADDNPRLRAHSPLIDRGDAFALPDDFFDLDQDGMIIEPLAVDLDFLPRIVGDMVDVGAFEFQGIPCSSDVNGDGTINVADLLAIIMAWGQCRAGQSCGADLDINGEVNAIDLLDVLINWGQCPQR